MNVAARLQAECPPGGICVTRPVRDHVRDRLNLSFEDLGALNLKNIARPVEAFLVTLDDATSRPPLKQDIRYCRTPSGVRLAYAAVGQGPTLVRCGRWFTHLEYEWRNGSKFPNAILKDLATEFQILRYDARGTGMSDGRPTKFPWKPGSRTGHSRQRRWSCTICVARGIPKRGSGHRLHGAKS